MTLLALPSVDRATSMSTRLPALDHKVEERLRRSSYLALRDISCLASDGVVTLRGRLPSYYLKQVAQELASGVGGVRHVVNRIEVLAPAGRARPGQDTWPASRSVSGHNPIPRGEDAPPRTHARRKEFAAMLVLSRKRNETIVINGNVRIMVVDIRGSQVRLGIEAPDSVGILREELCDQAGGGAQLAGRVAAGVLRECARD